MRRAWAAGAAAAAVAVLLAAAFAAAGTAGLIVAADVIALATLLAAWAALPSARRQPGPGRWRPAIARTWRAATRRWSRPGFSATGHPAFRKIRSDLTWAGVSMRHYDHSVRPLLARLLAGALLERGGAGLARDPAAGRDAMGGDLWPLVDPSRPPSQDSHVPGIDVSTLTQIVDRLERL